MLAIALLVSLLLVAGGQTAFATSHKTTAAPQPQQTILWLNAQGQITRRWKGSLSEAQIITNNYLAMMRKLHPRPVSLTSASPAAVSPNINPVDDTDCANDPGTVYWKLWNNEPVCFANAGTASGLNIYDVYAITTGNNEGNFVYNQFGDVSVNQPGDGYQICQQVDWLPATSDGYFDDVTLVSITAPNLPCEYR